MRLMKVFLEDMMGLKRRVMRMMLRVVLIC